MRLGLNQARGSMSRGRPDWRHPILSLAGQLPVQLELVIVGDHRAGIAADNEGGVGIGGVHDHLEPSRLALAHPGGEIPLNPQGHGDVAPVHEVQQLFLALDKVLDVEPVIGGEPVDELSALHGAAFIKHGQGHMLDVEIDHVAIGEQLHQGRHDEEKAELLVPKNLDELLDDDMPDTTKHGSVSGQQ